MGQVHFHRGRLGVRRVGGPASGRFVRPGVHDHIGSVEGDLRAAWRGQQLPGARGRYRVHVSRERALELGAEEDVHVREPRRPGAGHPVAHPVGGFGTKRGRPASPHA